MHEPDKEYTYEKMSEYPHMLKRDAEIWHRFIEQNPGKFLHCIYDLHVGDGAPIEDDTPPRDAYAWKRVTQWRADVAAWDGNALYMIEVKPNAKASAIGQALGYKILYLDNNKTGIKVVPVVLTDNAFGETEKFAAAVGVEMWYA